MEHISKTLEQLSLEKSSTTSSKPVDPVASVELTPEEVNQALYAAKLDKYKDQEKARIARNREAAEKEIMRPWNAKELFMRVEQLAISEYGFSGSEGQDGKPVFELDDNNIQIVQSLAYYFTNDSRFEKDGLKLSKGICLAGNVGLGKSLLMRLFARNKRQCYNVVSCRRVSSDYATNGEPALNMYGNIKNMAYNDATIFYQKSVGFCFDDLGTEETKKHYGNQLNVMAEIMQTRYDHKHLFGFEFTHLTTNLTADEIESNYGTRIRDRFREMFNMIELKGETRRK